MQKITKYLCRIMRQAAKIANRPFKIYDKGDFGDIVTDVDHQVEKFLIAKLKQRYLDFTIVSEEYNPEQPITDNCFVIDPIDATKNFAAGIPLWAMQIAAIQNGDVISSVIYIPKLKELYYADCDGAFLNKTRLQITPEIQAKRPLYEFGGGDKLAAMTQMCAQGLINFRYIGTASLSFAWVAAGRLCGFSFRKDTRWDYLPGMYLVKMAGGYLSDQPGAHSAATTPEMLTLMEQITDKTKILK